MPRGRAIFVSESLRRRRRPLRSKGVNSEGQIKVIDVIVRHAKSGPDSLDESVAWKFEAFDRTF